MHDAAKGVSPRERDRQERRAVEKVRQDTFRAVADAFMVDHGNKLKSRKALQSYLDRDLLPAWGELPIKEVGRQDVKDVLRKVAKSRPVGANRLLALIRQIFNYALDEEQIDASPVTRIKPLTKEVERERVLTADEIKALWLASDNTGFPFGPFVKVLLLTGQRRNEVARIQWSELDLDGGTWTLPGERAKRNKGHLVPLSPLAVQIIKSIPEVGRYVFSSGRVGDRPISGFGKAKLRIDALSKVEGWTLHDLRRTVATGMRELGVDRLTVSKVLNHSESGVTKVYDRYAADPEKRRALERWSHRLETLLRPKDGGAEVVSLRG